MVTPIATLLAAAALAMAGGSQAGLAVPATPVAFATVACDVPPRSPESIVALLATPIATPPATTGGATLPQGEPANDESGRLIATTVQVWLACQNAGEPLRAWSIFTDGYLYRLLSRDAMPALELLATPSPSSADEARIIAIQGERVLPDGRLGALVTIAYPSVPMPKTFFFFFTRESDRLLIDGILGEISFSVP